ncbi:MAG: hypothetical protein A2350_04225, partial [Candidatus Raymondbacteria bacterium RifOxyB12_full_50_8]
RLHSFSEAAEKNNVTQSSASQAIQALEHHLGAALINRSCRPWKLTPEGKTLYDGVRDILDRWIQLESNLRDFHDKISASVRIGSIYSVGLRHMKQHIQKFTTLHPNAHITIEYLHPHRVYECVINEDIDIGIVSFPQSNREITVIPWQFEPMVVVCHPEHRLAKKKTASYALLNGEKLVGFDKDLVIRKEVDHFLKTHNVATETVLEFDNIESIKRAVEIASGISLLPRPTVDSEIQAGSLCAVSLPTREFSRPLGIIHRKGKVFSPTVRTFVDFLQKEKNSVS